MNIYESINKGFEAKYGKVEEAQISKQAPKSRKAMKEAREDHFPIKKYLADNKDEVDQIVSSAQTKGWRAANQALIDFIKEAPEIPEGQKKAFEAKMSAIRNATGFFSAVATYMTAIKVDAGAKAKAESCDKKSVSRKSLKEWHEPDPWDEREEYEKLMKERQAAYEKNPKLYDGLLNAGVGDKIVDTATGKMGTVERTGQIDNYDLIYVNFGRGLRRICPMDDLQTTGRYRLADPETELGDKKDAKESLRSRKSLKEALAKKKVLKECDCPDCQCDGACTCTEDHDCCGGESKHRRAMKHYAMEENLGQDIDQYQKWVDYDMKKYGRISDITNRELKKAGLKVVKDKYGDYEVMA